MIRHRRYPGAFVVPHAVRFIHTFIHCRLIMGTRINALRITWYDKRAMTVVHVRKRDEFICSP